MTQHHGRLSIYMGIIKRTAELTRELSNTRTAAMGLVKTGHIPPNRTERWALDRTRRENRAMAAR